MDTYGLQDVSKPEAGKFEDVEFQKLYDEFVKKGTNIMDALRIGAFIEEHDIDDLKKLIAETKNQDIIRVYSNLLRGSENHLRAFVKNLAFRGTEYTPKVLTNSDFNAIIQK